VYMEGIVLRTDYNMLVCGRFLKYFFKEDLRKLPTQKIYVAQSSYVWIGAPSASAAPTSKTAAASWYKSRT
jgi:hypothetical protein